MNTKKWTAAVLAAGMFFTTNFMTMGVAEMAEQREAVFRLSRFQGMKNKEVARELGISEKTVEYHLSKAIAELRSMLGKM